MNGWGDRLELIATGCVVVLIALSILWLLTAVVGRFFMRNGNGRPADQKPAPVAAPLKAADEGVPEHHRVAIAAAVAQMMEGRPHRVAAIRVPAHRAPAWRGIR